MNPVLYKARTGTGAGVVLEQLVERELSACPVVKEDGRLRGVVTLRSLATADWSADVERFAGEPGMAVAEDTTVGEVAELMADTGEHHVVVVTATGHVVGIVSTIDVIRELCAMPPRWPEAFPHFDSRHDLHWSNQHVFDFDRIHVAPLGPGIFSLLCRSGATEDHVIWSEYSDSLRDRLLDLLAEPTAEIPALCDILSTNRLRFRFATITDRARAKKIVDALQRESGHAVER